MNRAGRPQARWAAPPAWRGTPQAMILKEKEQVVLGQARLPRPSCVLDPQCCGSQTSHLFALLLSFRKFHYIKMGNISELSWCWLGQAELWAAVTDPHARSEDPAGQRPSCVTLIQAALLSPQENSFVSTLQESSGRTQPSVSPARARGNSPSFTSHSPLVGSGHMVPRGGGGE